LNLPNGLSFYIKGPFVLFQTKDLDIGRNRLSTAFRLSLA